MQELDWKAKLAKKFFTNRLAHEAAGLKNLQTQQTLVERLAKKTQDGTVGQATGDEGAEKVGDFSVGNESQTFVFNEAAKPAKSAPSPPRGGSLLKKVGLLAALLAAGGGVGAAVPWLLGALQRQAPVAPAERPDQDTLFDLRFGEPPQATE